MSLLETARWMAHNGPHEVGAACWFCNGGFLPEDTAEPPPKADCPWLAMPNIVAAMEGLQARFEYLDEFSCGDGCFAAAMSAIEAFLRGEP